MPRYTLAIECIDEMREAVKKSADEAVTVRGKGEATLCEDLALRLKQKPGDKGLWVKLPQGTTLNFFRADGGTLADDKLRREQPRNLDHFYVNIGEEQYTIKAEFENEEIQGFWVIVKLVPAEKFPPGTSYEPAHL